MVASILIPWNIRHGHSIIRHAHDSALGLGGSLHTQYGEQKSITLQKGLFRIIRIVVLGMLLFTGTGAGLRRFSMFLIIYAL